MFIYLEAGGKVLAKCCWLPQSQSHTLTAGGREETYFYAKKDLSVANNFYAASSPFRGSIFQNQVLTK